jgi:hypothetical protein
MVFSLLVFSLFTAIAAAAGPPRVRETLDIGWHFFQGDAEGLDKPEFNEVDESNSPRPRRGWRTQR